MLITQVLLEIATVANLIILNEKRQSGPHSN